MVVDVEFKPRSTAVAAIEFTGVPHFNKLCRPLPRYPQPSLRGETPAGQSLIWPRRARPRSVRYPP
eukprot:1741104-Lingulodinium_polyedra.AAC.1